LFPSLEHAKTFLACSEVSEHAGLGRRVEQGVGAITGSAPQPLYSHSSLEAFRQCPRRYFYRYVARVPSPEEPAHIAAFVGTCVHEALEHLFARVADGQAPTSADVLVYYDQRWQERWAEGAPACPDGKTPDHWRQLGAECITGFYHRHAPFDQAETIGLELFFKFPIDLQGRYQMCGYIDRLARRRDGVLQVHDYKLQGEAPTQADVDEDRQLPLYHLGLRETRPDARAVELVWHFQRHGISLVSRRTDAQLEALRAETIGTIKDIESRGEDELQFPTRESPLCDWCEHRSVCPVGQARAARRARP
jgi:putative RecB family exonuclease